MSVITFHRHRDLTVTLPLEVLNFCKEISKTSLVMIDFKTAKITAIGKTNGNVVLITTHIDADM